MNSKSIKEFGPMTWEEFSLKNESRLLEKLPLKKGVYAIKFRKNFGRFSKKSDIMYFGSTKDKNGGLRRRIRFYFHPGGTQETSIRIHNKLKKYRLRPSDFWISWIPMKGKKKDGKKDNNIKDKEKKLLNKYEEVHGELPPWNRSA